MSKLETNQSSLPSWKSRYKYYDDKEIGGKRGVPNPPNVHWTKKVKNVQNAYSLGWKQAIQKWKELGKPTNIQKKIGDLWTNIDNKLNKLYYSYHLSIDSGSKKFYREKILKFMKERENLEKKNGVKFPKYEVPTTRIF